MYICNIPCPIRWITGISCAGCGMTRAWLSLLQGKITESLYYHPLALMIPIILCWWFLKEHLNTSVYKLGNVMFIIIFLVVYIIRLLGKNDLITIDIFNGVIYQVGEYIIKKIL